MEQFHKPAVSISVAKAILIGHAVVNLPVVFIILTSLGLGALAGLVLMAISELFSDSGFFLLVLISTAVGILLGWLWWSYSVPRWRQWALLNGANADQLHRWAVLTGLEWPKGSVFEKTEFRLKR